MNSIGTHILAEYSGCDAAILDDCETVEELLVKAAGAAGATVVARKSHRLCSRGVISIVVLQESHLSVHTWPDAGYAAADFFTCGKCDPHRAHPTLAEGLRAQSSEVVVLERGLPGTPKMRVLGHRPVERILVDCRSSKLPETVRVERSPGRGLGLFATRAFEPGDLIYETSVWLASFDTEYIMQTDVGESVLSADELGTELTIPELLEFPVHIRAALASHYGLDDPSPILLREHMTDGRNREILVTSFDGLMNHSRNSNTRIDWPAMSLSFENDEPVWTIQIRAARCIDAGEELFWDYMEAPGFVPPSAWLP
jgi:S-adenosylmethionine decarboxylase proenzyme